MVLDVTIWDNISYEVNTIRITVELVDDWVIGKVAGAINLAIEREQAGDATLEGEYEVAHAYGMPESGTALLKGDRGNFSTIIWKELV